MPQPHPDRMVAHAKHGLEFFKRGVGMPFNVRLKLLGVEFAPMAPACFRGQRALLGGQQIPIDGTSGQIIPPGSFGFGAAALNEFHHPFPQVQRIGFHALKPIMLCPNVNMKCYIFARREYIYSISDKLLRNDPPCSQLAQCSSYPPFCIHMGSSCHILEKP